MNQNKLDRLLSRAWNSGHDVVRKHIQYRNGKPDSAIYTIDHSYWSGGEFGNTYYETVFELNEEDGKYAEAWMRRKYDEYYCHLKAKEKFEKDNRVEVVDCEVWKGQK